MKNKIINKLNEYLRNNFELSVLCDSLSNDPEKVLQVINKIIKYAFVTKTFTTDNETLVTISQKLNDIDSKYQQYLTKKTFSLFPRKVQFDQDFISSLDQDFKLSDLKGLLLPTKEKLEEICDKNKLFKVTKNNTRLDKERKFKTEGFTYSRTELITITKDFLYDYPGAIGDIEIDFYNKYQESRYLNRANRLHPLTRDYQTNIDDIKTNTDILLKKVGDVYEIHNGRHRILYIIEHQTPVEIPVIMTRRIEDPEFNEILYVLKVKYNAKIRKNNLLNDEPNILINIDKKAYIIKDKKELLSFYRDLKYHKLDNFSYLPFDVLSTNGIETYENIIYQKYLEIGESVLTSNFTDLSNYFDNINNLFYQAYENLQQYYQQSIVDKIPFNEYYEKRQIIMQNAHLNAEQWVKVFQKTPKKDN